jgi:D-methionine transport system substrate-binding protein
MKKIAIATIAAVGILSTAILAGCGTSSNSGNRTVTGANGQKEVVLRVGAVPVPHEEILKFIKPELAKQGIDLQIVEYQDYVQPNRALADKDLDANYFQHVPYLNDYNQKNHTDLVPTVSVHFEPLGLYAGKSKSLSDIPDGAKIAVPNDTTNEARALMLLASAGLIQLKQPENLSETKRDIVSNPHHLQVEEIEAATIPRVIHDVNYAVINGNYAIQAGYNVSDALVAEKADSLAAKTFANCIVVRKGDENNPAIVALDKAITSAAVEQYINNTYHGSVIPIFTALQK